MSAIRQATSRALHGLKMMLGRGRIKLTNENAGKGGTQFVQAQVSANELMDLPRVAEFGFASRVPVDGDCIVVFLNAERSQGVVIATGHQKYRFELQNDGEAVLHDAFGKSIWLRKDSLDINAGGKPVNLTNAAGMNVTTTQDIIFNMGGKNFIINNPGSVQLAGAGGKKLALDQDPVAGGLVQASSTKVTGK